MFVITLKSTTYRKKNISKQISLGNQIVWQLQGQQKIIIAVGNKDEWASNEPLPEDSVIVGLIEETITNPNNAIDLWDVFLTNISLYTTNFTEPLSYQDSAFLKLPKFP